MKDERISEVHSVFTLESERFFKRPLNVLRYIWITEDLRVFIQPPEGSEVPIE